MNHKPIAVEATISLSEIDGMLQVRDVTGHTFRVPLSLNGLRIVKAVLEAKELEPEAKIGSAAIPTQAMIEGFLKGRELENINHMREQMEELKELF